MMGSYESAPLEVSMDTLEREQENIEESLDDLLTFPTLKGLRHSLKMIEVHFFNNEKFMEQRACEQRTYQSQINGQQHILNLARKVLNGPRQELSTKSC